MLNGVLFNIINIGFLVGFFDISVSCFDDCHIIKFGCCCGRCKLKLFIKRSYTRTNIFNIHNNAYIIVQGHRGDQGGGISFFTSYISLGVYTCVQLNTFHVERYRRE